ncbi:isoprenylcysteine carboxylmethyltransferase family protein [candidate division KSB1 bacterium]|nr:isoprenylcysteine carboxylmethyltransferase family protein [candidate division KSB1 bacterium]
MLLLYISAFFFLLLFAVVLFRVLARRDYLNKGRLSVVTSFLEFVIFALHANMMYLFIPVKWPELPPLSENSCVYYFSLFFIIVGMLIVFGALVPLGYNRTMGLKSKGLKTNGLYKWSRNPQVVGYFIFLTGFVLSYLSFYSAGWIFLFGIIIHIMIFTEEKYLTDLYGKEYQNYQERVPRYIGISRH